MFKFIHAADLHLDSPLRGLECYEGAPAERIRGATRRALQNLVQLAIDERAAFVLIAGDIYDGDWKDYNTGLFFLRQLATLREAGIRVVLLAGNHDAQNKMTRSLDLRDRAVMLSSERPETVRFDEVGVAIHGQGFATAAVTDDLSKAYPPAERGRFNIGMLHTSAAGYEGHERYAPCEIPGLRSKGYDYWALGHIHKQQSLSPDVPIWFSGNLQGRNIRESGPKGCLLATVDDAGRVRVEPRRLDVLRWEECTVDASGAVDEEEVLERFSRQLAQTQRLAEAGGRGDDRLLAVRVVVQGACAAHARLLAQRDRWTAEIRARAADLGDAWVEKVKLETVPPQEPFPLDGPIGELLQLIDETQADEARLAALAGSLADLRGKLGTLADAGSDWQNLDDSASLRRALDDVRWLLADRLQAHGDRA